MQDYGYRVVGTGEEGGSLSFMLDSLLKSRIETGEETTDDEDVNVYLAGLLHSFMDSSFFLKNGRFLSQFDGDVFSRAEADGDMRLRYRVYKGNADFALMSLGMFGGMPGRPTLRKLANSSGESAADRGRLYYRVASSARIRLRRNPSGVSEVLEKLAERFDTYTLILSHLRVRHFHLLRRVSRGAMFHLQRDAHDRAKPALFENGRDWFLDAYWTWLQSGSEVARGEVNRLGAELNDLDGSFRFEGV